MPNTYAIIAALAYLLGSIPFGLILVKVFTGKDVRAQGSGNIGATNVARTGRKGLAIATLALDTLKGYAAVKIAIALAVRSLGEAERAFWHAGQASAALRATSLDVIRIDREIVFCAALAALMAVIGHLFPVWLKFKGGKGVATGLGVFLALAPLAVSIVLGVFILIVAFTRYVSLGSIIASALFPFAFWTLNQRVMTPGVLAMTCAVALLIVIKHRDNIRRLAAGNENKFGRKKA